MENKPDYKPNADIAKLKKYITAVNIAEDLDDNLLEEIGRNIVKDAKEDDETRVEWFEKYNEALKIAKQTIEKKTYPFENAANIKLPLVLQGCVQFNSRIYPEIIQNGKTVQVAIVGKTTEQTEDLANRLANHMSLQTLKIVENWNSDTDKMLMILPLIGTVFRKWCYDPIQRKPSSHICLPTEIIISNDSSSIETAPRITHILKMTKNEIIENIRFGLYREVPLPYLEERTPTTETDVDDEKELPSSLESDKHNYIVYEQECWLDLDEDGYKEPYIGLALKDNNQVLRISARFDEKGFIFNKKGQLVKIIPKQYFTAHHFLPSFDGTFLGMGFGQLLLQLNSAIDTITNNLLDAGTLSNLRGGFLDKSLRLQKGDLSFAPGEFKMVNVLPGQKIADSIYPLPITEPSQTLFSLLQFLVEFGKQVANISDVLMGNPIGAEMPATSVVTLVEQGTKIYSSILSRLYESLRKEFNILYQINRDYSELYPEKEMAIKEGLIQPDDYKVELFEILPIANPALGLDATRLAKMQVLMQLSQDPLINRQEVLKRYFNALGISDSEKLFAPPPPPSPLELKLAAETDELKARTYKTQMEAHDILMKNELDAIRLELDEKKVQVDASYKGGQLAAAKVNAISTLAKTESEVETAKVEAAKQMTDTEQVQSTPQVDLSGIETSLEGMVNQGQQPQGQQPQGQQPPGQPQGQNQQAGPPGQMPGDQGGQEGQGAPELPPELEAQLQQIAANQGGENQGGEAPQGV